METVNASFYRDILRDELVERIEKNPRYSLRSFSTSLGISSGALSQILSGKRSPSTRLVQRIFARLELSPLQQRRFLESLMTSKNGLKRKSRKLREETEKAAALSRAGPTIDRSIGLDELRVIADWYHTAILELTFARGFKSDPRWIAQALGITVTEAKLAVERLQGLELIESVEGRLRKTHLMIDSSDKSKTSPFLRRRQAQILEKSRYSLDRDPIEERCHTGVTVCVDPDRLPEAKTEIQRFLWDLTRKLASGNPSRVYELGVHLFPLQKKGASK